MDIVIYQVNIKGILSFTVYGLNIIYQSHDDEQMLSYFHSLFLWSFLLSFALNVRLKTKFFRINLLNFFSFYVCRAQTFHHISVIHYNRNQGS